MKLVLLCLALVFAAVEANLSKDRVLVKSPQPRYQFLQSPEGAELADTWIKESDVARASKYQPDKEIVYYFFSRANPVFGVPVALDDTESLIKTDFSPLRRTAVIVHGWKGNSTKPLNQVLVPAFLKADDYNVIVVDWGSGAQVDYIPAVLNTITSGPSVARFLDWLTQTTGVLCSDIHLVGHSLGGHLVGIAGRNANCDIDYITALDPSWTLWVDNTFKFRPDDGAYTEVIHTNAGKAGYLMPLGQVDFYANDGIRMPGCDGHSCSHNRCWWYFAESLNSGGFTGTECDNHMQAIVNSCKRDGKLKMGGTKPKFGSVGVYRFDTNPGQPYSKD